MDTSKTSTAQQDLGHQDIGYTRTTIKKTAGQQDQGNGYSKSRISDTAGAEYRLQQDLGKGYSCSRL